MLQETGRPNGGQSEDQGRQGKGQSNPGGFDQQSSSSMQSQQAEDSRRNDQQRRQSQQESNGNAESGESV